MKKLYTARQAGEYLGIEKAPRQHVHALLSRGKFPKPEMMLEDGKRGHSKFWTKEQLDEYKGVKKGE